MIYGPWIVRRDPNEPESAILSVNSGILDLSGIRFARVWRTGCPSPLKAGSRYTEGFELVEFCVLGRF